MTSRAEYRLLLRQDNADERLTELGYNIGLINDVRYNKYVNKQKQIAEEIKRAENTLIKCSDENNNILEKIGSSRLEFSTKLSDLLKRSELNYDNLKDLDLTRPKLDENIFKQAAIIIKYEGYIKLQKKQVESFKKLELKQIPQDFDYDRIQGIRLEGKEKLKKFTPQTVGQASRISGVSPADITVLLLYLETYGKK